MPNPQLPAHLQNANLPRLADRAADGMGSALPPHISIRGNEFTLVDASGEERTVDTKHLDVAIIDRSDKMNKLYYGKDWTPDSNDPPLCFSANGVAPSRDAMQPQSATCEACQWNVRGSAVSKLSGASIKACRDEVWLGVLVPGYDIPFQFRVTPGSFKNFKGYVEKFKGQPFDLRDVVTRLQFEKDSNGVVTFTPASYIDEATAVMRNKLLAAKVTDAIVGRLDQPIGALPAPAIAATEPGAAQHGQFMPPQPQTMAAEPPKTTRGRPRKPAETAQQAAPPAMAPFRPTAAPAFGIATGAPEAPPRDMAAEMDSFFKQS